MGEPPCWICVNCDGTVSKVTGDSITGGVLRDSNRGWILGYTRFLGHCTSLQAELWALQLVDVNASNVQPLVRRIVLLRQRQWETQLQWIPRKANLAADTLIKVVYAPAGGTVLQAVSLSFLREIIVDGMSKWRICSDDGSNYRWEDIGPVSPSKLDDDPKGTPIAPYPSMVDLLLEGSSKLIENDDRGVDKYPMFKTEFGNSVALKESSIAKAVFILNEDELASTITPSGRSLFVSSEALKCARTLLGESEVGDLFGEMDEEFLHIEFTRRKNLTMHCQTRTTSFLRPFPTKEHK
ncbi:hypothetical protein F3Y22_tig00000218pilonHSYRG00224 [Hibiscus syriacus]|uniref:RNase H type-1 domain-containing protein n=1 Tax=Hibiscus syriacus TaxID=106335 RepID=A0A6A3D9N6_HIBSY|nr:hypothetical protein F3Y22_tig00000218pilonHSYRG00224 [Hibiscus syriacus]